MDAGPPGLVIAPPLQARTYARRTVQTAQLSSPWAALTPSKQISPTPPPNTTGAFEPTLLIVLAANWARVMPKTSTRPPWPKLKSATTRRAPPLS